MSSQTKAKIFLSDERNCDETESIRSYNTFNTGAYYSDHKQPFNYLYELNDLTLAAGHHVTLKTEESSLVLLLPVVGNVCYYNSDGNKKTISPGQLQILELSAAEEVQLANQYPDELINLIEFRIKAASTAAKKTALYDFNLEEKNALLTVTAQPPFVSIGKFEGRHEAVYNLKAVANSLFAFVIEGVFEVNGRLLHARDGLGLWNINDPIEMEALSNDAIVLLLELSE